jgi:integrase
LRISCEGNYDADIVISRTATGVVYARGPEARLAVREPGAPAPRQPRLLDRVRDALRARHGSRRTEKSYVAWIRRYILFHGKRHRAEMGAAEVTQFLSALAVQGNVAASTQNQALSALLFLYRHVLEVELPWLDSVVRAKQSERLPVVLTREEVCAVLRELDEPPRLMAIVLYGAGLRLLECAHLRVKDVDFAANQIVVRAGKGDRDRVTMLPAAVKTELVRHLELVKSQLPWALARKYPNAGREWVWQWVFPATGFYVDPRPGRCPQPRRPPAGSVTVRADAGREQRRLRADIPVCVIRTRHPGRS